MTEELVGSYRSMLGGELRNTDSESPENIQTGPLWVKGSMMGEDSKGIGISLALAQ